MAFKYIFWDSDNTLVDTFALHWAKHVHALEKHGIALSDSYKPRIYRNNGIQNWQWLRDEMGLNVSQQDYLQSIDRWYIENSRQLRTRNGVIDTLNYLQNKGLKQCVVSNGRRASVPVSHQAGGISDFFEFVLCKEDYEGRKPEPLPFLTALQKMEQLVATGISPTECLAIDDDPLGVESAKRAGMTTVFRPLDLFGDQKSEFADYTVFHDEEFLPLIKKLTEAP